MGTGTSQIREELDNTRDDAASRIDELQNRFESVADQATGTVEDVKDQFEEAKEHIKESLDLKQQISNYPLIAVGAGAVLGFLLAGMGDDGHPQHRSRSRGGMRNDLMHQLRESARSSGLEDTLNAANSAFMETVSQRIKSSMPTDSISR